MNQTVAGPLATAAQVPSHAQVAAGVPRLLPARRVFLGALALHVALTLFWAWLALSGGSTIFYTDYRLSL